MALYKRATCSSKVVASSSVCVCESCGYTQMGRGANSLSKCPECGGKFGVISNDQVEAGIDDNDSVEASE